MHLAGLLVVLALLPASSPQPTPSATPTPAQIRYSDEPPLNKLADITLGEAAIAVTQRLGRPDYAGEESSWYYDRVVPGATLQVMSAAKVVTRISLIYQGGADVYDRYGVQLGGTVDDLLSKRGNPNHKNCHGWLVYEIGNGVGWFYQIELERNIVTALGVGQLNRIYCPTEPL